METITDDSNSTVTMNTLDTVCEMNTLDTVCEMNTLDTVCEMNTLDTVCEMNTLDTVCEMNTLDTVCEMNTLETVPEMNTLETVPDESKGTVTMNTLETVCEMNTLETVLDESKGIVTVNTLDTVYEVKNQDTICDESKCSEITKTDEIAACESNCSAVMDSVVKADKSMSPVEEAIISGSNCAISSTSKRVAAESHEPECKKAKLESNNPVKDSLSVLSQSDFSLKEEDGKSTKSCDDAVIRRNQADSSEKQSPLTETQAGITEYLGSHKGFSAVIKQRYSDFIVNEIDMLGNVVQLTQMELSECLDKSNTECEQQEGEITSDIISKEDIAKLENLIKSGDKNTIVNIIAPQDKDARTKIHLAIKKKYPQAETKTADVDGQKMIQVMWKTGKSRDRNKDDWPESKKDYKYVKFVLYKENKDTMDAIGLISKNLKVKESLFQYAGTKDKRAKTSQEITSYKIHPKKLSFMNKVLWNMGLGNFQYVKEPLKLGQLSGNQFTIVLRNVQESLETVNSAITSLKTQGFINYFGMQRFGTTLVPTHRVGCSLLHGDWEKAVDLILMPRDDNPSKDAFQKVWMETKDPEATLKVTPPYCGLERNLLEALKKKMKPFNALEKISRNTRLLYIHSYQAFVWNQMVSKRLKVFGFQPIVGDLVLKDGSDSSERLPPVLVTQDNLKQFSLYDVVLPLPGHDVIYPKNEVYDWYRERLTADGVDIDNMKRPQKDYSLPGAYRHITVCPSNVDWTHHRYDDYSLPLTLSDMDIIKGIQLPASQKKGKFKAVVLKMTLPSSCYATMALREVLHVDTSVAHQTSLNVT